MKLKFLLSLSGSNNSGPDCDITLIENYVPKHENEMQVTVSGTPVLYHIYID